jgi:hypothetical protein
MNGISCETLAWFGLDAQRLDSARNQLAATEADATGPYVSRFDFSTLAWRRLLTHRLGRTVLLTNRMDWTAEQVAAGYSGQQSIERVFRGLKDGEWLGWGPIHHWPDRKIRIHAFLLHARHLAAAVCA